MMMMFAVADLVFAGCWFLCGPGRFTRYYWDGVEFTFVRWVQKFEICSPGSGIVRGA